MLIIDDNFPFGYSNFIDTMVEFVYGGNLK